MDIFRLLLDCIILSAAFLISQRSKGKGGERVIYALCLLFAVFEVYFIYRGQENSDLFFWHAYTTFSAANIVSLISRLRAKGSTAGQNVRALILEHLVLWQVVIVTVFAGFALCVGWLMKLYIR